MSSTYAVFRYLLLLSVASIVSVTAGPLPTTRPQAVVDVRLDPVEAVPSTGRTWHIVSDSDIPSLDLNYDNRADLEDFSRSTYYTDSDMNTDIPTHKDLTLRSSSGVAIGRREVAADVAKEAAKKGAKGAAKKGSKDSQSGGSKPGDGMQKASQVTGDISKGLKEASAGLDAAGPVGEVLATAVQAVSVFLDILSKVFGAVAKMEEKSAKERGEFTQKAVAEFEATHKGWNVICAYVHDKHAVFFEGVEGKDWTHRDEHTHTILGKYEYEVYGGHAGMFILEGDGGYENWAYTSANVQAVGYQRHRLLFGGPPPKYTPQGPVGAHVFQYNKGTKENPGPDSEIVVILKDKANVYIGYNGQGDLKSPVTVNSLLPHPVTFTAKDPTNKDSELDVSYDKLRFPVVEKKDPHCSVGGYDHNTDRQFDCTWPM